MSNPILDAVREAMSRAFQLGQAYWQDGDSESTSANKRADSWRVKFNDKTSDIVTTVHRLIDQHAEGKRQWDALAAVIGADGDNVDQVFQRARYLAPACGVTRFCPECGFVGEVSVNVVGCCPDGSKASYVSSEFAPSLRELFDMAVERRKESFAEVKETIKSTLRQTHTYATLAVPRQFYEFVAMKMADAGYPLPEEDGDVIDMHGLALVPEEVEQVTLVLKGGPMVVIDESDVVDATFDPEADTRCEFDGTLETPTLGFSAFRLINQHGEPLDWVDRSQYVKDHVEALVREHGHNVELAYPNTTVMVSNVDDAIPEGWVFQSADSSLEIMGVFDSQVCLVRDDEGMAWLKSVPDDMRDGLNGFVIGVGTGFDGALENAIADIESMQPYEDETREWMKTQTPPADNSDILPL